MKNKIWNETVKNNFNNASANYLSYSNIQKHFADKIVYFLKDLNIQKGEWIDLGSGTGLLADEIEKAVREKASAIAKELEGNPSPKEKISKEEEKE